MKILGLDSSGIVASVAIVVVSLATAKPDAEIEKVFDEVRSM